MGNLKVGDEIIVTDVLQICKNLDHLKLTVHKIYSSAPIDIYFPYQIEVNRILYWVEGIPYSPLMMELW